MAHFAKLDKDNTVLGVHVVADNDCLKDGVEDEATGISFLNNVHGWEKWKQTSYNATIRKRFAGMGDTYDETRDAFIAPKPYPSWILNETTCEWEAPVGKTTYYLLELNSDGTGPGTFTEHDAEGNPVEIHQVWNEEDQLWAPHEPNFATTEIRVNPDPSTKYQPTKPNVDE